LDGFFEAINHKSPIGPIPGNPLEWAVEFLSLPNFEDWEILAEKLFDAYTPGSPELAIIKNNLDNHLKSLYRAVSCR
jgi:hypothetical protein